jgi:hypothetical protein
VLGGVITGISRFLKVFRDMSMFFSFRRLLLPPSRLVASFSEMLAPDFVFLVSVCIRQFNERTYCNRSRISFGQKSRVRRSYLHFAMNSSKSMFFKYTSQTNSRFQSLKGFFGEVHLEAGEEI